MSRWAIVLAAGDGRRVSPLTFDGNGDPAPKQFWRPLGQKSLLRMAIERAGRWAPVTGIVVVVSADHKRWWHSELLDLPLESVIVQPLNRGTAAGILLPFLHILDRDPDPLILVLPSDHHVADEKNLAGAIRYAASVASLADDRAVLLGMTPQDTFEEYGWIVVATPHPDGVPMDALSFVEKPDANRASELASRGGLINSMILSVRRRALYRLFARTVPGLLHLFTEWKHEAGSTPEGLCRLYESLPTYDFSRDVLQSCSDSLLVLPVNGVGWVDLGTPGRLWQFVGEAPTLRDSLRVNLETTDAAFREAMG